MVREARRGASGYSGKPAWAKLGIVAGTRLFVQSAPADYDETVGGIPDGVVRLGPANAEQADVIHLFARQSKDLHSQIGKWARRLKPGAALWVSWPKASSGVATDLGEGLVRETGLATGLVDVKVCAVDETWSGLKFMHRTKSKKP